MILHGDCIEMMKTLPDCSVDAVVTDPPYGLSFMGKKWDYDVPSVEVWAECLRILKPGGYLLAFAGTRTQHRMAVRIEDAGFEIRDMIAWVYGSGFPKSLNIGKAVDKLQGNKREVVGKKIDLSTGKPMSAKQAKAGNGKNIHEGWDRPWRKDDRHCEDMTLLTKGTSEWEGWGTALKPALEPITVARKPFSEKSVAENVLKCGTGGINIDGCRVGSDVVGWGGASGGNGQTYSGRWKDGEARPVQGRFPANLIHDGSDEVVGLFPESKSGAMKPHHRVGITGEDGKMPNHGIYGKYKARPFQLEIEANSGSAARFFYCAKASKSERNEGCEELPNIKKYKEDNSSRSHEIFSKTMKRPNAVTGKLEERKDYEGVTKNAHPTVKPITLMEYLVKLVSREGATVLDPFLGSGTTAIACVNLGRNYIGIERESEYVEIAKKRIEAASANPKQAELL